LHLLCAELQLHHPSLAQLNEYQQVLSKVCDSLDSEQIRNLCYLSEEASLHGRENLHVTMLLSLLEQMVFISPVSLEYIWIQLHTIGQSDLCELIEQYTRTYLDEQPAVLP